MKAKNVWAQPKKDPEMSCWNRAQSNRGEAKAPLSPRLHPEALPGRPAGRVRAAARPSAGAGHRDC